MDQTPKHRFMFDPRTQERMAWDFLVLIPLLVYLAITMPFKVTEAMRSYFERCAKFPFLASLDVLWL